MENDVLKKAEERMRELRSMGVSFTLISIGKKGNSYFKRGLESHAAAFSNFKTGQSWTKLREDAELGEACQALDLSVREGSYVPRDMLYRVLKGYTVKKDLDVGRRVHALALKSGYEGDTVLASHIIRMYASHGKLEAAKQVLSNLSSPDTFVWASLLSAYVEHGQARQALQLYREMRQSTVTPNNYVLVAALKACSADRNLTFGKEVHADIVDTGFERNVFVGNTLVDMYAKCGSLLDARAVFDRLPVKNVITWTAMIGGYAQQGLLQEALNLYGLMKQDGVTVSNKVTYVCLLKACANVGDVYEGRQLHIEIQGRGLETDVIIGSSLVDMYAKGGSWSDARTCFDRLTKKNLVTWGAMIGGYANQGLGQEALALYDSMEQEGIVPDRVLFLCALKACAIEGAVQKGMQLHIQIRNLGLEDDVVVGSSLVDMYAKCGNLEDAQSLFDRLSSRDVVLWGAMIGGYVQHGFGQKALDLFERMQQEGLTPDKELFVCTLNACASTGALQQGEWLHCQIKERGLEGDLVVSNTLVDMYVKCGSLEDARRVFDTMTTRSVVTWTAMTAGYAQQGVGQEVLDLLERMQQDGVVPDKVALICSLKACGVVGAIQKGKQLHSQIRERGMEADIVVGSSLVGMYARCGSLDDAQAVFKHLSSRDVITWNAMLAGYGQYGVGQEVLNLYENMQQEGVAPDEVSFVCTLKACGSTGAIEKGRQLHSQIQERGLEVDLVIGNALVDMYAKCGRLEEAQGVFDRLPTKDVVAWTVLINAFSHCNDCARAFQCFEQMLQHGVEPDEATFVCLLVACSHCGLVNEGKHYFNLMVEKYGIAPTADHYSCMVDLLARSGHLDEAEHMLHTMPYVNDIVGWTALLSACKTYCDVERGRQCFHRLVELQPQQASSYVLMCSIYAQAGMWGDIAEMEELRLVAGAWKKAAKTWLEANNKVHEFTVGEMRSDISSKLGNMNLRVKEAGHVPHTELVLKPFSEQEKEDALCGHAEKLALAYGLLSTPDGTTLLVTKNLRMCSDCHSGTKVLSRIEKREIIVRDTHRVHHFRDGACSCGDSY